MKTQTVEEDVVQIAKDIGPSVSRLSGKTFLITGGAGFLGKYFPFVIDYLNKNVLEKPCKMIVVDNFVTGIKSSVFTGMENAELISHNVIQPLKVDGPVDFIVHAAGIGSPVFYNRYPIETIQVGTTGTVNMLELAMEKGAESFLFFSSSEVYGDPDPRFVPTSESYNGNVSCIGPRACYDESKRMGETLCINYFKVHNVPVKMVRPFNVYGPGMRLDDFRVIPNFVANALEGKPLPVYGAGTQTRTFCYVSDAITGFFKILLSEKNGEVYNIGSEKPEISMEDLAKMVIEVFDNKVGIQKVVGPNETYTKADPKRRCPDLKKAREALGYSPRVELKDGIRRFVRWVREYHNV